MDLNRARACVFVTSLQVLIKAGAEVNMRNGRGETALHHAARNEHQKTVDLLLRAGTKGSKEPDASTVSCPSQCTLRCVH